MKISTKGRYSLRLLLDLAQRKDEGFVALRDVAQRSGISKKYLEQLVPLLNGAELLRANRGAQGGYMLARAPSEYTVGEILRLTEGGLCPVDSAADDLPLWKGLQQAIDSYLDGITLQDILDERNQAGADAYCI